MTSRCIIRALASVALALCAFPVASTQAQTPRILWQFDTRDASFGQSAAGDIDGDGRLELVFGCYRNDSMVYALNAEDGSLLWKVNTSAPGYEGCNDTAPLLLDTDGDGRPEVIVPASCTPATFCIDGRSGALRWSAPTRGSDSPPSAADIDGDGLLEILHGEFGGYVICLNAEDGSMAWEMAVDTRSWIQTAPTIVDLDRDGRPDFVVATWNKTAGDTNRVYAFRGRDRALLWTYPLPDVVYHGSAVADADGDGRLELFIGDYSGTLHALRAEDGSAAWTHRHPSGYYIGAPVSAGDLDGDGLPEMVAVNWYKVLAYNGDGSLLWEYSIDHYSTAFRGAALADIDGDARPDVLFGTSSGQVTALHGATGTLLWTLDLAAQYGDSAFALDHAPVIADFNGDDTLDLFIVGGHAEYPDFQKNFGRAYAITAGRGSGPDWLLFQNNARRDGNMLRGGTNAVPSPPLAVDDVRLWPQPARQRVEIEARALACVDVFDCLGRRLLSMRAAGDRCTLQLDDAPPGIYVAVVRAAGTVRMIRFAKL